jgi:lactoylglutathione lyase
MQKEFAEKLVEDFELGRLSRRQLVTRIMGLGAAAATFPGIAWGQQTSAQQPAGAARTRSTFRARGLDHVALNVTDVGRSREFYQRHLGLQVIRGTGDDSSFLGADRDFFVTLFRAEQPGMNHYCYAIDDYDPADAVARLTAAGITPRRTGGRVYFPDPDGLTVQVAGNR